MTVNGKENKGEDIKNPKLERKEQIEGEDHQIMNQEVDKEFNGSKRQSARSYQRLQTISSSISSLILLSSTSAGF